MNSPQKHKWHKRRGKSQCSPMVGGKCRRGRRRAPDFAHAGRSISAWTGNPGLRFAYPGLWDVGPCRAIFALVVFGARLIHRHKMPSPDLSGPFCIGCFWRDRLLKRAPDGRRVGERGEVIRWPQKHQRHRGGGKIPCVFPMGEGNHKGCPYKALPGEADFSHRQECLCYPFTQYHSVFLLETEWRRSRDRIVLEW